MRIGIYARGLSEKVGGAKQVIESMTKSFIRFIDDESKLFILHNCGAKMFKTDKNNVEEVLLGSKNKILSDHFLAPNKIYKLDLDAVWFPKNVIPYRVKAKKIVTILDVVYFMPKYNAYPFIDTIYMKRMIKSSCKRADRIIAISENTKKDLVKNLGINKTRIEVIHLAADERYRVIENREQLNIIKEKYGLNNDFILFTGGISPRKNLIRLIQAFNELPDEIPHELVLTGGKGWKNEKEMRMIKNDNKIKMLGLVPPEEMPFLYNLAEIYVYPSLYEGFGLPILEAQACGSPVICSNVSSIPEAGGDAVLYIDPYSIQDIKEKIEMLIHDESLKKELIKKGFQNVKRFSWHEAAKKLLNICREGKSK